MSKGKSGSEGTKSTEELFRLFLRRESEGESGVDTRSQMETRCGEMCQLCLQIAQVIEKEEVVRLVGKMAGLFEEQIGLRKIGAHVLTLSMKEFDLCLGQNVDLLG